MLKHNRVRGAAFAVSPYSFNPLEKYGENEKLVLQGDGMHYRKNGVKILIKYLIWRAEISGVDIYDRNVYPGILIMNFRKKYKGNIVGSLPMNKIDIAYKGYMYGITMNTVKYSSTMEARRIFELMA